jgi:hypothetical protein
MNGEAMAKVGCVLPQTIEAELKALADLNGESEAALIRRVLMFVARAGKGTILVPVKDKNLMQSLLEAEGDDLPEMLIL